MQPPLIAFDLDGTLVDSDRSLWEAVNLTRAELRLPPLLEDQVAAAVGHGVNQLLRDCIPESTLPPDQLLARYKHHYGARLAETPPYPDADATLRALLTRGARLALCTNKPERFARMILEQLGWHAHFERVVGGDTLGVTKPDPRMIHCLGPLLGAVPDLTSGPLPGLGPTGVRWQQVWFVGDSEVDAETAVRAGCRFVRVATGKGQRFGFPSEYNHFPVVPNLGALVDLLFP